MSQDDSLAALDIAFLAAIPSDTIMLMIDACFEANEYISDIRSNPFEAGRDSGILIYPDTGEEFDDTPRLNKMELLRIAVTLDISHLFIELEQLEQYLADWGHSMLYRQLEKLRPGQFRERLFGADLGL